MLDPWCTSIFVPLCGSAIQGSLPCLCTRFDAWIWNSKDAGSKKPQAVYVEENYPCKLYKDYMKPDFDTLKMLHSQHKHAFIQISGPIGVGKTILLQRYNNEFKKGWWRLFDVVIFVKDLLNNTSSIDNWISKVQKKIGDRLGITPWVDCEDNQCGRAEKITEAMQFLSFVVIIDNVMPGAQWEHLGIPNPSNSEDLCTRHRKVVFSATNCSDLPWRSMVSNVIELHLLDVTSCWNLFTSIFLQERNENRLSVNKDVESIAKELMQLYGGSPKHIFDLARDMSNDPNNVRRWQDHLNRLKSSTSASPNSGEKQLSMILHGNHLRYISEKVFRSCFLFLSLFPSGYSINIESLIDYLICEGLFETTSTIIHDELRPIIHEEFIQTMRTSKLIRSTNEDKDDIVQMGHMDHSRVLQIAEKDDANKTITRMSAHERTVLELLRKNVHQVRRASFINSNIQKLECTLLDCTLLKTLILCGSNKLCSISKEFWSSMINLRILDLSHTSINEITDGICTLCNLRLLNLSFTDITKLPIGIIELSKLEYLDLEATYKLQDISNKLFSHLCNVLRVLKINNGYNNWSYTKVRDQANQIAEATYILELEQSKLLEHLAITINSSQIQQVILDSERITSFTKHLQLTRYNEHSIDITNILSKAPKLEELHITSSDDLNELTIQEDILPMTPDLKVLFMSELNNLRINWKGSSKALKLLSSITIMKCNNLKDVTWIINIPRLQYVNIRDCQQLEKLVTIPIQIDSFPMLRKMTLNSLPMLVLICCECDNIIFDMLESISITKCVNLMKLPLPKARPRNLKQIQGEQLWWDNLCNKEKKVNMILEYIPIFKPI